MKPTPGAPMTLPTRATLVLIQWYAKRFRELLVERARRAEGNPRPAALRKLAAELGYLPEIERGKVLEAMALVEPKDHFFGLI
jgi:hypothetical protein